MDKKKKKATKAQRERIDGMLKSGLIDRDEAKDLIEMPRNQAVLAATDPALAFWEEKFPNKGKELMDLLRPYYDWKAELKVAIPNLKKIAKETIFWREIKGVRILRFPASFGRPIPIESWLTNSLSTSFRFAVRDSLEISFQNSLDFSRRAVSVLLRVEDSLWNSLGKSLWYPFAEGLGENLGEVTWCLLKESLFHPCAFILAYESEEAAKFKPLLDLWLAGNFPLGFDKKGNLLVLVAD